MVYFVLVSPFWYISLNILLSSLVHQNKWLDSTHFKAQMISAFLIKSSLAKVIWVPFRLNALSPSFLHIHCPSLSFSLDICSLLDLWIFTWAIPPPLIENTFEQNLHDAENTSVLQGWIQANSASLRFIIVFLLLDI